MNAASISIALGRIAKCWPTEPLDDAERQAFTELLSGQIVESYAMRAIFQLRGAPRPTVDELRDAIHAALVESGVAQATEDTTDYAATAARGLERCRAIIRPTKEPAT